ncbi:hypothetical protein HYQ46_012436 [Verticillium longisporum]|nr:hypothetical protein HYQ44_010824 [Verticillium longisporum]KAG7151760.1 hypothetical protein HYQ46_012436 [Verticillium longisporum]
MPCCIRWGGRSEKHLLTGNSRSILTKIPRLRTLRIVEAIARADGGPVSRLRDATQRTLLESSMLRSSLVELDRTSTSCLSCKGYMRQADAQIYLHL